MILTTFFSKSKPINFILIGAYMMLFYGVAYYKAGFSIELFSILGLVGGLVTYIFTMLGIDFVAKRNELCKSTSYNILLFAVFTAILPVALQTPRILMANAALILAVRRVISLRSQKYVQKKILDASLWIMLASVCYFWSVLFFGVVFLGIALYAGQNYRNWLIPFVGVFASYSIGTSISLLFWDRYFSFTSYISDFSIFFVDYKTTTQWIAFGIFLIATLFFLIFYLVKYKSRQAKTKPAIILVMISLLITVLIVLIAPQKNTAELLFVSIPLAIMGTSYLESGIKPIIREILLWILITGPVLLAIF